MQRQRQIHVDSITNRHLLFSSSQPWNPSQDRTGLLAFVTTSVQHLEKCLEHTWVYES